MYKLSSVVAVAAAFSSAAHAVIINVPGDQPTIQAGIGAAEDGDEIVVAPGTYFETINFLGKGITLRSSGGSGVTIIDAQGAGSVVTCDSGEGPETVLDGFTATGGTGTLVALGFIAGGGMLNTNSSPEVANCTFIGQYRRRRRRDVQR